MQLTHSVMFLILAALLNARFAAADETTLERPVGGASIVETKVIGYWDIAGTINWGSGARTRTITKYWEMSESTSVDDYQMNAWRSDVAHSHDVEVAGQASAKKFFSSGWASGSLSGKYNYHYEHEKSEAFMREVHTKSTNSFSQSYEYKETYVVPAQIDGEDFWYNYWAFKSEAIRKTSTPRRGQRVLTAILCKSNTGNTPLWNEIGMTGHYTEKIFQKKCTCSWCRGSDGEKGGYGKYVCGYTYKWADELEDHDEVVTDVKTYAHQGDSGGWSPTCPGNSGESWIRAGHWNADKYHKESAVDSQGTKGREGYPYALCYRLSYWRDVYFDRVVTDVQTKTSTSTSASLGGYDYLGRFDTDEAISFGDGKNTNDWMHLFEQRKTIEWEDHYSSAVTWNFEGDVETHGCGYDVAPNCLPGYCAHNDEHCWTCTRNDRMIDPDFSPPDCSGSSSLFFQMTGDCDTQGDCVSSKNWPNVHGHHESCQVTMLKDAAVTVGNTFDIEEGWDHLIIRGEDVTSTDAIPSRFNNGETFTWTSDSSVSKVGWQFCFSNSFVDFVVLPSTGGCPQGRELTEAQCEGLSNSGEFSSWETADTWGLPETCGCFLDQNGKRYFNRLTGECNQPDSGEQMICKATSTVASSAQENAVGRNVFAEFVDEVSIVNDKTLIMSLAFIGFFYTIFYAYRLLTKAAKYSEIASEQEV